MTQSGTNNFWQELLRRKVIRTGLSYAITAWLIIQILDVILPAFSAPEWVLKVLISILALGLPIAMALAWSFDIKPAAQSGDSVEPGARRGAGVNIYLTMVALLAIGYIVVDKVVLPPPPPATEPTLPSTADEAVVVPTADRKSLAIIPFKNLSTDGQNQYFSDGIMEAILNELSLIRDLKVVSRTSVEAYRDTTKSIPQIARELNVANVLEGSVQRAGNKVRVTAQLIAADEDKHLWSRNYDRNLDDIFAIQSEIANAIASNLELILTSEEREALSNAPTSELRAYDLYLRSQFGTFGMHQSERPPVEAREALQWCEEARDLDPEFALAYNCIALNLFYLGKSEYMPVSEWRDPALENVEKAIRLDPRLWQAYALLSDINAATGDWPDAFRYAEKVLEVNPNQPVYLMVVGFNRLFNGERSSGIDMILDSLELIPRGSVRTEAESVASNLMDIAPDVAKRLLDEYNVMESPTLDTLHGLAARAMFNRDYEGYLENQQRINQQLPTPNNQTNLGLAYLFTGDYEKAREIYEDLLSDDASPEETFMKYPFKHRYAYTLMETGEEERGMAMLLEYRDELLQSVASDKQLHGNKGAYYDLAVIYCALGEIDEAEKWLQTAGRKSREGAFFDWLFVNGDRMLEPLWNSEWLLGIRERREGFHSETQRMFSEKLAERQRQGKLLWLIED